ATNVRDAIAALDALQAAGIQPPTSHVGLPERLLARLRALLADAPRRAAVFERAAGPDTLLHGDLWTINVFVKGTAERPELRLVDWDRVGVGPFSYDLSTFLFRFPAELRPGILDVYRRAAARGRARATHRDRRSGGPAPHRGRPSRRCRLGSGNAGARPAPERPR